VTEVFIGFTTALWLGILTSISPCPLASNVAAISFLSKKIIHPGLVFLSGAAYTLGRMVAYAILGLIIIDSLLSVPQVAQFLQKYVDKALGPVLILTGLFLLKIITIRFPKVVFLQKHHNQIAQAGAPGAFLLGFIFALAFCPVSAALFFGSLIPLALSSNSGIFLPFIYGIGTGLPVLIFAVTIAFGVTSLSHWFNWVARLEYFMRRITGCIFIAVGMYYTGIYVLGFF